MKKCLSLTITSFLVLVFAFVLTSCPEPKASSEVSYDEFESAVKYIQNKGVVEENGTANGFRADSGVICEGDGCCIGEGDDCCIGGDCDIKSVDVTLPNAKGFILTLADDGYSLRHYITPTWSVQTISDGNARIEDETESSFSIIPSIYAEYVTDGKTYYLLKFDTSEAIKAKIGGEIDENGFSKKGWTVDEEENVNDVTTYDQLTLLLGMISDKVKDEAAFNALNFDSSKGYAVEVQEGQTAYIRFNSDKKISRISALATDNNNQQQEVSIDIEYKDNLGYKINNCPNALPDATDTGDQDTGN